MGVNDVSEKELIEARARSAERRANKRLPSPARAIQLNPEAYRTKTGAQKDLKQYGLTKDQWLEMVRVQESKCAICGMYIEMASALAVDHCHRTGAVRGLLCRACNFGLGFFKDDIGLMAKAIHYLTIERKNGREAEEPAKTHAA
jgi:hypothetical protein